jgi:hypothetical protein
MAAAAADRQLNAIPIIIQQTQEAFGHGLLRGARLKVPLAS